MSRRAFLGEFEQIVLLAVRRLKDEGYGVTIRREISARTGRDVAIGSVYTTLERLEKKAMVRSFEGAPTAKRGGRARRHFELTPVGIAELSTSRAILDRMWEGFEIEAGSA